MSDVIEVKIVSDNPSVQEHYRQMVLRGESHKFAEMIALGRPPFVKCPNKLLVEDRKGGKQFKDNPIVGDYLINKAVQDGVYSDDKVYMSSLARYQGDPEAWVSDTDDVKRVLDARNWSSDGLVKRTGIPSDNDVNEVGEIADDIVTSEILRRAEVDGKFGEMSVGEAAEMIRDEMKPNNNNEQATINKLEHKYEEWNKAMETVTVTESTP